MIIFENDGTLDMRAVTTMGISAKDPGRDTIGFFGTGLKYAIAVLLRTGHDVWIQDGAGKTFRFGTTKADVRGEKFDIVTMAESNHTQELGFTTDLGKNWEVWQAFRELYCNAQDEGGQAYEPSKSASFPSDDNKVRVVVHGKEITKVWNNRSLYILPADDEPLYAEGNIEVYRANISNAGAVFCKGICVGKTPAGSIFRYNITRSVDLSEDRLLKYEHDFIRELVRAIAMSENAEFIEAFTYTGARAPTEFESQINFCWVHNKPTDVFLDVVGNLRIKYKELKVNPSAVELHKKYTKVKSSMPAQSIELTNIETMQLTRAKQFCADQLNIDADEFKLIITDDLGDVNALGRADMESNIMYLSRACFAKGTKYVVMGLIEEHTHLKHRVHDETLEQKQVYLEMIATLGERLAGEPL